MPITLKSWKPYHDALQPVLVRSLRASGGRLLARISAVAWAGRSYLCRVLQSGPELMLQQPHTGLGSITLACKHIDDGGRMRQELRGTVVSIDHSHVGLRA